jgi:hypothetical protein
VSLAFLVVRHEVFHRVHPLAGVELLPGFPMMAAERLDYDSEPSCVYSLYLHLGRPAGMDFTAVADGNPDWLNRLLLRKKEADLGVAFHAAAHPQPGWTVPDTAWNNRPAGDDDAALRARALRPTVLEAWTADHDNYGPMLARLGRGEVMLAARDVWSTPIRVLLGDFLGVAGVTRRSGATTERGVRVEVFSTGVISPDFTLVTTDAARGWTVPAGAGPFAVRYPSEWSRVPEGAEKTALQAAGVNVDLVPWWSSLQAATAVYPVYPDDGRLDGSGSVVHYDPDAFMAWLNRRTWHSEWPKYQVTDAGGGVPAAPRPRVL